MIGGPADGRWMVAEGAEVIVADWGPLSWKDVVEPSYTMNVRQTRYVVQTIAFLGIQLDVALAEREFRSSRDRDNAVIRALFQRDVAEAMGAYK
jgi:hypothetical protein